MPIRNLETLSSKAFVLTAVALASLPMWAQEKTIGTDLVATYTSENFSFSRSLHDSDGDGWCDLWCDLFPTIKKIPNHDSDGDGMTDYEEMILMQNPFQANPAPRHPTPQEIADNKAKLSAQRQIGGQALFARHQDRILEGYLNLLAAQDLNISPSPKSNLSSAKHDPSPTPSKRFPKRMIQDTRTKDPVKR